MVLIIWRFSEVLLIFLLMFQEENIEHYHSESKVNPTFQSTCKSTKVEIQTKPYIVSNTAPNETHDQEQMFRVNENSRGKMKKNASSDDKDKNKNRLRWNICHRSALLWRKCWEGILMKWKLRTLLGFQTVSQRPRMHQLLKWG